MHIRRMEIVPQVSAGPLQPLSETVAYLLGWAKVPYVPLVIGGTGVGLPFGSIAGDNSFR